LDVMFGAMSTPAGLVVYTAPTWAGGPRPRSRAGPPRSGARRTRADDVDQRALADAAHALDDAFPRGNHVLAGRILPGLTDDAIDDFLRAAEAMLATCVLNVHHSHGAATHVPVTETAYAYRDEHLVIEIIGAWAHGDGAAESAWVRDTERRLDAQALPGGWANLIAHGDQRASDACGINTSRLLAVKSRYDPDGVFTATPLPE
jgi:hypothetical protein